MSYASRAVTRTVTQEITVIICDGCGRIADAGSPETREWMAIKRVGEPIEAQADAHVCGPWCGFRSFRKQVEALREMHPDQPVTV